MVKLMAACSLCVGSVCIHTYKCGDRGKWRAFVLFSVKTMEGRDYGSLLAEPPMSMDCLQQLRSGPWCLFPSKQSAQFFGSPLSSASA